MSSHALCPICKKIVKLSSEGRYVFHPSSKTVKGACAGSDLTPR